MKPTNPKDAIGVSKPPLSAVPGGPLFQVGAALLYGGCKYGRHNYRPAGVRASVYFDAVMRHLWAWWEGEDLDPDSGVTHLAHACAGLMVFMDSEMAGNHTDDRPPRVYNPVDAASAQVDGILRKFPDPKPPFTNE